MKGDFSRTTFSPSRHYSQLQLQQGRVLNDADWNEQAEIALYDARGTRRHVIGPSGGSLEHAALRLEVGVFAAGRPALAVGGKLLSPFDPTRGSPDYATPGLYWVEGNTLTQERAYPLEDQPHLKEPLPTAPGLYFAWVDSFERLLTALDVPEIREVALEGPDHGTRVQQVWQVRLFKFDHEGAPPLCRDVPGDWRPREPTGRLHARAADPNTSSDPCAVPQSAGYRRLENQLYRVEIRSGGDETSATFVWSRDNGVVRVLAIEETYDTTADGRPTFQVAELGRDELTRLAAEDWVEITDDARTLAGQPGHLCQIAAVSNTTLELHAAPPLSKDAFMALKSPSVRRWDQVDPSKHPGAPHVGKAEYRVSSALGSAADDYFDLEDGVQIRFSRGTYRPGDYWLLPARTVTADVEFSDQPELPHGVPHRAAGLAILQLASDGNWTVVRDCRRLFAPLTKHQYLHYVGGDGQEAMPGGLLGGPLEVAVTNAGQPVEGVTIRFRVTAPDGTPDTPPQRTARGYLLASSAAPPSPGNGALVVEVSTDARGIASVRWVLGTSAWSQHVTARVASDDWGDPTSELHFHATQSIASEVHADIAACATNEDDATLRTVQALMGLAGIDPSNPQHRNVQHVLHQLLCRLNAGHVPYRFPSSPSEIPPASVDQVKSALDALYWLVLQRGDCCCLADVIEKLADLVGGKAGAELCKALQAGPVEGDCSLLELTLGMALNLVRTLYAVVLAFLDLDDAPGPDRGYEGLRLGDEQGIELAAFIHGEGPAWFAGRIEERRDQVDALGDQLLDVIEFVLEGVLEKHNLVDAFRQLAAEYGQEQSAWNGPATRTFILARIWLPLFETPRLDDAVLVKIRELLFEIVTGLWREFVELLLCGEPIASRIPAPQWLGRIADNLGRALDRALGLHGLVHELPREKWGTPRDVHMMGSSDLYPEGATWVVAEVDNDGQARPFLLRWRHDGELGPLAALHNEQLGKNLVLREPELVITMDDDAPVLDSGAGRDALHVLISRAKADPGEGPENLRDAVLWLVQTESQMEGFISEGFPPQLGSVHHADWMASSSTILVAGGPDDPPTVAGPAVQDDAPPALAVWPPTVRRTAFFILAPQLRQFGVPDGAPGSMHGFTLDESGQKPGRFLALAMARSDNLNGRSVDRNLLLILGGTDGEGTELVPWWQARRLVPIVAFDLPPGVSVKGGAHDLIAVQDDGQGAGSGERRWMFIGIEELLRDGFPSRTIVWDDQLTSTAITEFPEPRWREGDIVSVVHGNDGPWVQALGPLASRLGLYRAFSKLPPLLQRQMVRGATGDDEGLLDLFSDDEDDDSSNGQSVPPVVPVRHDYLLQSNDAPADLRLLTVCIRTDDDTPMLEFHASPRS